MNFSILEHVDQLFILLIMLLQFSLDVHSAEMYELQYADHQDCQKRQQAQYDLSSLR